MDPMKALIDAIRTLAPSLPEDVVGAFEARARAVLDHFELVPKHDYEAHIDVLKTLERQVATLEQRLEALEQPSQSR